MCEEKEESRESNDLGKFFSTIRKMHPFVIAFSFALSFFSGIIFRSNMPLVTKLTVMGTCFLLTVFALCFEAYRIDREEKQNIMRVFR
jgi:hypothetical protein